MNTQHPNRFLKTVVILLIVVNAMVLVLHFKPMSLKHERPHGGQLKQHLIEALRLDPKQEADYSAMVERHRAAMDDIKRSEEETRIRLYADPGNRKIARDSLFDRMADLRKKREIITFGHFTELRDMLDSNQAKKFDAIIAESVNGMEGPPRGRR